MSPSIFTNINEKRSHDIDIGNPISTGRQKKTGMPAGFF